MRKLKNSIWGALLVLLGVLIAIDVLGIVNVNFFFDGFWTLFIIVPCAVGLIGEKDKKENLIGLAIGILLLLACRDIIRFEMIWKLIIPVILIVIGVSLIFRDKIDKQVNAKIKELNDKLSGDSNYGAFFSGENLDFHGMKFDGADNDAVFGGFKLDLRDSIIENDVVVKANAVFGGIDIYIPQNVNVQVQSSSLFGGVSGARNQFVSETVPTLYINASSVFGGVSIK